MALSAQLHQRHVIAGLCHEAIHHGREPVLLFQQLPRVEPWGWNLAPWWALPSSSSRMGASSLTIAMLVPITIAAARSASMGFQHRSAICSIVAMTLPSRINSSMTLANVHPFSSTFAAKRIKLSIQLPPIAYTKSQ